LMTPILLFAVRLPMDRELYHDKSWGRGASHKCQRWRSHIQNRLEGYLDHDFMSSSSLV
jgi:hypothetical protein